MVIKIRRWTKAQDKGLDVSLKNNLGKRERDKAREVLIECPLGAATGDLRIVGFLGMIGSKLNIKVYVNLTHKAPSWIANYLQDCHCILGNPFTDRGVSVFYLHFRLMRDKTIKQKDEEALFLLGDALRNENLKATTDMLRNLLNLSHTGGARRVYIYVKKKGFVGTSSPIDPADAYHEEHKLSLSMCIALAYILWYKYGAICTIQMDQDNSVVTEKKLESVRKILMEFRYKSSVINLRKMCNDIISSEHLRGETLLNTYRRTCAEYGGWHIGGRSGHLEVMGYLGQRVFYIEDPNCVAGGNDRLDVYLHELNRNGPVINRIQVQPTTAGGRGMEEVISKGNDRKGNPSPDNVTKYSWQIKSRSPYGADPAKIDCIKSILDAIVLYG